MSNLTDFALLFQMMMGPRIQAVSKIHSYLLTEQLPKDIIIKPLAPNCAKFEIQLPGSQGICLSVVCPMDAHPPDDCSFWVESALLKDDHIVYSSNAGYDDVCRFYSKKDFIAEILRISELARNNMIMFNE